MKNKKKQETYHIFGKQFPEKVIPLINNCKKSLHIIVFVWKWYEKDPSCSAQLFNQSIVRAARRGVDIKVISNDIGIVKILKSLGIKAKKPTKKCLIHSKIMIIDEKDLIIGSHNYTQSAFNSNHELSTYLKNCDNIKVLLTDFNNFYNKHA